MSARIVPFPRRPRLDPELEAYANRKASRIRERLDDTCCDLGELADLLGPGDFKAWFATEIAPSLDSAQSYVRARLLTRRGLA